MSLLRGLIYFSFSEVRRQNRGEYNGCRDFQDRFHGVCQKGAGSFKGRKIAFFRYFFVGARNDADSSFF